MAVISTSNLENWNPKTVIGKKVKNNEITNIDTILDSGYRILEPEIVDTLVPNLAVDLLEVGQSKGKFGGGKGSIWKQTQKKTSEGTTIKFSTFAVVGNKDGYVGVGFSGAKETVPAREKAIRKAKLNIIKIKRACGSWACNCKTPHSIPFKIDGKCGSVTFIMMPAPRGTGIKAEKKCQKILAFAGITDVYTDTKGSTSTKLNLFKACFESLRNLNLVKVKDEDVKNLSIVEGSNK